MSQQYQKKEQSIFVKSLNNMTGDIMIKSSPTVKVEHTEEGHIQLKIQGLSEIVSGVLTVNEVEPVEGNVTLTDREIEHEVPINDLLVSRSNLSTEIETLKSKTQYATSAAPDAGHAAGETVLNSDLRLTKGKKGFWN
jgi:hypothetical protein